VERLAEAIDVSMRMQRSADARAQPIRVKQAVAQSPYR
jgi:hypothetical protein